MNVARDLKRWALDNIISLIGFVFLAGIFYQTNSETKERTERCEIKIEQQGVMNIELMKELSLLRVAIAELRTDLKNLREERGYRYK